MTYPFVRCEVLVSGGHDPTDEYSSLFILEFNPKAIVFPPNTYGDVFQMGEVANSVPELREFLVGGQSWFFGEQAWIHFDDEDIERFVKPLPAPFNDPDVQAKLFWSEEDIIFDKLAQILLDVFDGCFSEEHLQRLEVPVLQIILAAKTRSENSRSVTASRKAELVEAILADQKSKGLRAVRVKQTSLSEVFA